MYTEKGFSIGKGLDSIALALCIVSFMWFIYMLLRGLVLFDTFNSYAKSYRNEYEARCASLDGYYASNKCFIKGEEI